MISPLSPVFIQLLIVALKYANVGSVRVTSFIRSPERNESVGGVPGSLHIVGLAIDLVGERSDMERLKAIWQAIGLDAVDEGDHYHFELDGPLIRRAVN